MVKVILVLNSGSSSIKFSILNWHNQVLHYRGEVEKLYEAPMIRIYNNDDEILLKQRIHSQGHEAALQLLFNWLEALPVNLQLAAVGHRVVHGGNVFFQPTVIDNKVLHKLTSLISLAPLHQPHNLQGIKIIKRFYPKLPQVACFDTGFHRTQAKLDTLFAIPRNLHDAGVVRYGFHGTSYEYIATVICKYLGNIGNKRVIVAHLGNGASMCAMYRRKSVATSMGFTALDGLMMGTRPGRIDPGVLLYLLQEKNYSPQKLEHLLYNESGLLGVSGYSNNMQKLLASSSKQAKEAIDLFCYRAALEFGSLLVTLQGCDVLVFTAGIGEHAALVRYKICEYLDFLAVKINKKANNDNALIISKKASKILVAVIPTNEEYMIAKHVRKTIKLRSMST